MSLLVTALAWPLLMLLACLSAGLRKIMPAWLWLAPVPALLLALTGSLDASVTFSGAPYHATLALDLPGGLLLAAAAALWIVAGFYVPAYFRGKPLGGSFTVCWLFTLVGSLGIFLAADLASFLLFYALVSLPGYGFVIYDGSAASSRAGRIYLGFALLGENVLLFGFMLLAAQLPDGSTGLREAVSVLQDSPSRDAILAFLVVGFGMKMALLPLHFWMPLSYTAAPIPAAAVLGGAAVKAGVMGLLRFLPFGIPLPGWGETLTLVGLAGAFYGVAVGLAQTNPKTVLAYSSVSQMGFLAAVLGMGLSGGDAGVIPIVAFYAAHHVLVKGGLFLAVGLAPAIGVRSLKIILLPGVIIALGLAGLPLTGGALAKLAVKDPLGYGIVATLASLSAVGTAWLMLHFLWSISALADRDSHRPAPFGLAVPWMVAAGLCVVFPWLAFPAAGLSPGEILAPSSLWKTLWPVAAGVILFLVFRRRPWPCIPVGDIIVRAGGFVRLAARVGVGFERLDRGLRLWPVACCSLLLVVLLLLFSLRAS